MKKLSFLLIICLVFTLVNPMPATAEQSTEPAAAIGTNFWFMTNKSGEKPFKENVNWSEAYSKGEDIWNPEFLAELEPYTVLRYMDWGGTNNSSVVSWSQRRLPNVPQQAPWNRSDSDDPNPGAAYEWLIDLGNRTNKDVWFCVPHKADDNFIEELAKLVKEKLNPDLKCYIEYSNETWNSGFDQYAYVVEQGKKLNLPGNEDTFIGEAYNIYRSLQIFEIFQQEFGKDTKDRVVKVCSISGFYDWFRTGYRNIAYDRKWNPSRQLADVLCTAPYVGGDLDGKSPTVVEDFMADVDKVYGSVLNGKKIAKEFGLGYGTYEGGQHLLENADVFSSNPKIYDCYKYMLDKFLAEFDFFVHYAHCGNPSSGGAWGAKFYTGQPIEEAHRYRALVDWAKDHPVHKELPELQKLKAPKVGTKVITDRTKTISGKHIGNADVIMKVGKKTFRTVPDPYGDYKFKKLKLSKFKEGQNITVFARVMRNGELVKSPSTKLKLRKLPKDVKLKTKKLTRTTTVLQGKTSAKAKVKVLVNNKKYKNFKAKKNGSFKVKVNFKKFKKGTKIKIFSFRKIGKKEVKTKVLNFKLKK